MINSIPYCKQEFGGAGAGHVYTERYYTMRYGNKCFAVKITKQTVNCGVYLPEKDKYESCDYENKVTIPATIGQILSTFKFIEQP